MGWKESNWDLLAEPCPPHCCTSQLNLSRISKITFPSENCSRNGRNKNYLRMNETLKFRARPKACWQNQKLFRIIITFLLHLASNTSTFFRCHKICMQNNRRSDLETRVFIVALHSFLVPSLNLGGRWLEITQLKVYFPLFSVIPSLMKVFRTHWWRKLGEKCRHSLDVDKLIEWKIFSHFLYN